MRLPTIQGVIRRRMLINFRVDPAVIQGQIPSRFKPKLQRGKAIAGVCLIRLEHVRPKAFPELVGISSENAAHRVAVTWTDDSGQFKEGVYINRRDTDSALNQLLGGRVFPGELHKAAFRITESPDAIDFSMRSDDDSVAVDVLARPSDRLPKESIFESLEESSAFFEAGSVGYSTTHEPNRLDGMILETDEWRVEPLAIQNVYSSYFADTSMFPEGSVEFDHALLMRNIHHEWVTASDLYI
ncbi:MAG TPA: DUF2071 domain-containing protein [Blastocatellia bacterium]